MPTDLELGRRWGLVQLGATKEIAQRGGFANPHGTLAEVADYAARLRAVAQLVVDEGGAGEWALRMLTALVGKDEAAPDAEVTTYALGRLSAKTAAREHAQKMADVAAQDPASSG